MADADDATDPLPNDEGPHPEEWEMICHALSLGMSAPRAVALARIPLPRWERWVQAGAAQIDMGIEGRWADWLMDARVAEASFIHSVHERVMAPAVEQSVGEAQGGTKVRMLDDPRQLNLMLQVCRQRFPEEYNERRVVGKIQSDGGKAEGKLDDDMARRIENMNPDEKRDQLQRWMRGGRGRGIGDGEAADA